MSRVSAERVFRYADRFARRAEAAGRGTQYPTMRQAANALRCTYAELEAAVAEYQGVGYLGIAVAIGLPGFGYAELARGEQQIEAYR